ncbi:unnamed protein product [Rhizoctonia solani]|uniref:Asl1-like glycosyl hydrolase catalytic domain-containing protein n=1 Tax=Rhizoctonia solani TaxID=456999 RepID=A0A8H3E618_9AGAM|nr:unnamed protein product [Rhizoctonia solani]
MSWISKITTVVMAFFTTAPPEGKRGLAWPWYNENTNLDPAKSTNNHGRVQWIYNWETWRPAKTAHLNWIGTQRCMDCDSSPISQLKKRAQEQGWNTVLTLNEPDINGISARDAANWYIEHINPLQIKKAIPSVTSSATRGKGLDWAADFIAACGGHLIISEFALLAPAKREQQVAFLKSAMPFLDRADYVKYYAVFVASSPNRISANTGGGEVGTGSSLFNDDGSLSPNGIAYRG